MNNPRKTSPGGMLIVIVVAVLIVLIVLTVRAEHGDDTKPEPAEATPTVTTPTTPWRCTSLMRSPLTYPTAAPPCVCSTTPVPCHASGRRL